MYPNSTLTNQVAQQPGVCAIVNNEMAPSSPKKDSQKTRLDVKWALVDFLINSIRQILSGAGHISRTVFPDQIAAIEIHPAPWAFSNIEAAIRLEIKGYGYLKSVFSIAFLEGTFLVRRQFHAEHSSDPNGDAHIQEVNSIYVGNTTEDINKIIAVILCAFEQEYYESMPVVGKSQAT